MKDHKNCNCQHEHGGNGFTMGMLIGGALVFLTATDRGRKILREFTEMGKEVVHEAKDIVAIEKLQDIQKEMVEPSSEAGSESHELQGKSPGHIKRFFRGAKKR